MLELVISSSILIVLILLVRKLFGKRVSRRLLYGLWLFPAVRLLFPFLTLPATRFSLFRHLRTSTESVQMVLSSTTLPGTATTATSGISIGTVLTLLWVVGMVVVAFALLTPYIRFCITLRKSGMCVLREREGCLRIYEVESFVTPMLIGRSIYLPKSVVDAPEQYEYALAHEKAHWRHGDSVWNIVRVLLLIVYWFHPLVWVGGMLSKRDSEYACDEAVADLIGDEKRVMYCKAILEVATGSRFLVDSTGVGSRMSEGNLLERIRLLGKKRRARAYVWLPMLLVFVLAFGFTAHVSEARFDVPAQGTEGDVSRPMVTVKVEGTGMEREDFVELNPEEQDEPKAECTVIPLVTPKGKESVR